MLKPQPDSRGTTPAMTMRRQVSAKLRSQIALAPGRYCRYCQSSHPKTFPLPISENRYLLPPSRLVAEGRIAIVTDVERGMRWAQRVAAWLSMRTNDPVRTVKSCGLGAAVLASSRGAVDAHRDDGGKTAVPRRERV